jgi:hypothetical protein
MDEGGDLVEKEEGDNKNEALEGAVDAVEVALAGAELEPFHFFARARPGHAVLNPACDGAYRTGMGRQSQGEKTRYTCAGLLRGLHA